MGSVLHVDQQHPAQEVLERAYEVLVHQGVLVMPTDSVYGIGCLASEKNPAHQRVFEIKERPATMTLPWLISDSTCLERLALDIPAWAEALAQAFWPGALTLVVTASSQVPQEYQRSDSGTIALRVPDSVLVRELARSAGPLAVTSANTHGEDAAISGASVEERIVSLADLTLDSGPAPLAIASTIVDCTREAPVILREGALSKADILRAAQL